MKNIIIVLVFLCGITKGFGQDITPSAIEVSVTVADSTAPKFCLKVINPSQKKISISIYSENNGLVYSKDYPAIPGFKHILDFSGTEDGYYTLEIIAGKEKLTRRIFVSTEQQVIRKVSVN